MDKLGVRHAGARRGRKRRGGGSVRNQLIQRAGPAIARHDGARDELDVGIDAGAVGGLDDERAGDRDRRRELRAGVDIDCVNVGVRAAVDLVGGEGTAEAVARRVVEIGRRRGGRVADGGVDLLVAFRGDREASGIAGNGHACNERRRVVRRRVRQVVAANEVVDQVEQEVLRSVADRVEGDREAERALRAAAASGRGGDQRLGVELRGVLGVDDDARGAGVQGRALDGGLRIAEYEVGVDRAAESEAAATRRGAAFRAVAAARGRQIALGEGRDRGGLIGFDADPRSAGDRAGPGRRRARRRVDLGVGVAPDVVEHEHRANRLRLGVGGVGRSRPVAACLP